MFACFGSVVGIDLHDGTDDDEMPIGTLRCDFVEQLDIESLIDHAKETETRMRNVCLILGIGLQPFSLCQSVTHRCCSETRRQPGVDYASLRTRLCPPVKTRSTCRKSCFSSAGNSRVSAFKR